MADWAKIKFFWETMLTQIGSTLTATSTEDSGKFDVDFIFNMFETNSWQAEATGLIDPQYITFGAKSILGTEKLSNIGFETAGGGGADIWADWVEQAGDGTLANETTDPYAGTNSLKITEGASDDTLVTQNITGVVASEFYELSLYTAGDDTNDGSYAIYDVTNTSYIVNRTATGITDLPSVGYTQIIKQIKIPASCVEIRIELYPKAATSGAIAYFDNVSVKKETGIVTCDYLAILGHNLLTAGASITLQYSYDNFGVDSNDAFTTEAVTANTVYLKEFTAPLAHRYWRLKISGLTSTVPFMAICIWGNLTELDWVSATIDPYNENKKASINLSQGGFVTGVHEDYTERKIRLDFQSSDEALYTKVRDWWDNVGMNNFFMAWDITNNPTDIYLMRSSKNFNNPFDKTAVNRDISIDLTGRIE